MANGLLQATTDCLLADVDVSGKRTRCYLSLNKKAKKKDSWDVGVCAKSREDSAGQKPRATMGNRKMTTAEIRAALVDE